MTQSIHIANALHALPLEAPEQNLWPQIQKHLPKNTTRSKWPLALAASTVLAIIILQLQGPSAPDAVQNRPIAVTGELVQLMDRSAQLENDFYALQDDSQSSATVIAANLSIEDRLAAIDSRLMTDPASADKAALWQERVSLLNQGVSLNRTYAAYNADGQRFDLALASLN